MAAKRMFLINNLVTMATSFQFSPKLTLPHCAPPQCACPHQIWRDLVSKFSNGSQKNVFDKQLGYHGNQFGNQFFKLTLPHLNVTFEEIWSVSFQMAAKRMFLINNLVTMATSFQFSPKLTLPHCAPPQCACPHQIWRDLVSKFSNGSQKNVFDKQLGYHGNQFSIFT